MYIRRTYVIFGANMAFWVVTYNVLALFDIVILGSPAMLKVISRGTFSLCILGGGVGMAK